MSRLYAIVFVALGFVFSACSDNATPGAVDSVSRENSPHIVIPEHASEFDLEHFSGPNRIDKELKAAKIECNEKYELVLAHSFEHNCYIDVDITPYVEETAKYWCNLIAEVCKEQGCKKTHFEVKKWRSECENGILTIYILTQFACEG